METVSSLFEKGEYFASGLYEEPEASLFVRKAMGIRRWLENKPMTAYHGGYLYPSGQVQGLNYMDDTVFSNRTRIDADTQADIDRTFRGFRSSVPSEHTVAGNMWTHSLPCYERVLKEGFDGYRARVLKMEDADLQKGLLLLLDGISAFVRRCAEHLRAVGAREELIRAFDTVPMRPARDLYEAIVAWNFVMYLDSCDNLGCLPNSLMPYYRGEDATPWLKELFFNLDENGGYSMSLGPQKSPLLMQCLEAARGRRRPMMELMIGEDTDPEVFREAFSLVRTSGGQPAFYNYRGWMKNLKKRFPKIPEEDLHRFCGVGCAETSLAGMTCAGSLDAGINLPFILTRSLKEDLPRCRTFEGYFRAFLRRVKQETLKVTDAIVRSQKERAQKDPVPMRTLLVDDCIEKGKDFFDGGARYSWSVVNIAGLVNTVDSLLTVSRFVFEEKRYSVPQFLAALDADDADFLSECRKNPQCYGVDDGFAAKLTYRLSHFVFSLLEKQKTYFGLGFLPASIQFGAYERGGSYVDATPDGRRKGSPIADSLSPIFRKDVLGPTAALNSIAKNDLQKCIGTPIVNLTVDPGFSDETLKGLILGYMAMGGLQVQITATSRAMLEDAYAHPEKYPNLVVRVGGYSEYFYRLSDGLKRAVIERTILECGGQGV